MSRERIVGPSGSHAGRISPGSLIGRAALRQRNLHQKIARSIRPQELSQTGDLRPGCGRLLERAGGIEPPTFSLGS